ncbi:MAG TPA: DmsE family decaheme c-type cytochrome [Steroidobacteraceae bacterium]|nr:DmsE family decaheme c-type cytochrome [Steroidobacteraceae bacterium]
MNRDHRSIRSALAWAALAMLALVICSPARAQDATYIGESKCVVCHVEQKPNFSHTVHAKAMRTNPANELQAKVCEACHGPGSRHVKDTEDKSLIIGFTRSWGTPIEKQNGQCLECHKGGQRLFWSGSTHEMNRVACADCHNPMAKISDASSLRKVSISETCETCHAQQRTEFRRRSHMPVPEGKMSCADCHNPHGSVTRPLLKADSVNELCTACHAEKRGPFLWEHAPVRENCTNCHVPHGSNHDKLLVAARPFLCQQCHSPPVGHPGQFFRADQTAAAAMQGGTQSARIIGRSCVNCHSAVHGSNHPSGTRLQR